MGEPIQEFLMKNKTLNELRLNGNNQLGDDACVCISEALVTGAVSLRVCHMADTRLGNQAARVMARVIRRKDGG
jgi:hypothetical protein